MPGVRQASSGSQHRQASMPPASLPPPPLFLRLCSFLSGPGTSASNCHSKKFPTMILPCSPSSLSPAVFFLSRSHLPPTCRSLPMRSWETPPLRGGTLLACSWSWASRHSSGCQSTSALACRPCFRMARLED